jgi:ribosome recycling factor
MANDPPLHPAAFEERRELTKVVHKHAEETHVALAIYAAILLKTSRKWKRKR